MIRKFPCHIHEPSANSEQDLRALDVMSCDLRLLQSLKKDENHALCFAEPCGRLRSRSRFPKFALFLAPWLRWSERRVQRVLNTPGQSGGDTWLSILECSRGRLGEFVSSEAFPWPMALGFLGPLPYWLFPPCQHDH